MRRINLLLLAFPLYAFANLPEKTSWSCSKEINSTIQNLSNNDHDWHKVESTEALPSFKASHGKIGEWIILQKNGDKSESLILSKSNENFEYRFSQSSNCFAQVGVQKTKRLPTNLESFTDNDLKDLLIAKPQSIFLVWSPHMRLSVQAIIELEKLKIPFEGIMDPLADQEEALKFIREFKLSKSLLRRANSNELNQRNALNHYPALFVAKNGRLCSSIQRGFRKAQRYDLIIKEMREKCI